MNARLLKVGAYILMLAFSSCKSCKKEKVAPAPVLECKKCFESTFYRKVSNLKGTVRKVSENDYFYDGGKYYVEVSSSAIPELSQNAPTAKLFPCCTNKYDDTDIGKEVILNAAVFSCATGDHGRPSNNIYEFYVFN
jgi:hypothetical protein